MNFPHKPPIESISEAEWSALPTNVQTVVRGLVDENRQLKLTIAKLEEQLRRNSQNSSQPPSHTNQNRNQFRKQGYVRPDGEVDKPGMWGVDGRWCRWRQWTNW